MGVVTYYDKDVPKVLDDEFFGFNIGTGWTEALGGDGPVKVRSGKAYAEAGDGLLVAAHAAPGDIDSAKVQCVGMFIHPDDGVFNGTYHLFLGLDGTAPDIAEDVIWAELSITNAAGSVGELRLRSIEGGVQKTVTIQAFTEASVTGIARPGWFVLELNGANATAVWRSAATVTAPHLVSSIVGRSYGFGLDPNATGASLMADSIRLTYYSDSLREIQTRVPVFMAGGSVYVGEHFGEARKVVSAATVNGAVRLRSADRGQTLYVTDHGDTVFRRTDGEIDENGEFLFSAGVTDWSGVNPDDHVVVVENPTNADAAGTYRVRQIGKGCSNWQPTTNYLTGDYVFDPGVTTRRYRCIRGGVSHLAENEPTWPTGEGDIVTEVSWGGLPGVQWQCELDWMSGLAIVVDDVVRPTTKNGRKYRATRVGTTKATEPVWPKAVGVTVDESTAPHWGADKWEWEANRRYEVGHSVRKTFYNWQASHICKVGDEIRPTTRNGRRYRVIWTDDTVNGSPSGETEPSWPTGINDEYIEQAGDPLANSVKWKCILDIEYLFVCTTSGTSGATAPAWNETLWADTEEDTKVVWEAWPFTFVPSLGDPELEIGWVIYPTLPNEYRYRVVGAGKLGATEPTWPTTLGETIISGTATLRCERYAWQPSTYYPVWNYGAANGVYEFVVPPIENGFRYWNGHAGTSLATEPTWPTTNNAVVSEDGAPAWVCEFDDSMPSLRLSPPAGAGGRANFRVERGPKQLNPKREKSDLVDWAPTTIYGYGDEVTPINGDRLSAVCVSPGQSGSTEPEWPVDAFGTVSEHDGPQYETIRDVWTPNINYVVGDVVFATVADGLKYRCQKAGASGSAEPEWKPVPGEMVSETSGLEWVCEVDQWLPSVAFSIDAEVHPRAPNGYKYICTVAGTTGAVEPDWSTLGGDGDPVGETIAEGSGKPTWQCVLDIWRPEVAVAVDAVIRPTVSNGFRYKVIEAGTTAAVELVWPIDAGEEFWEAEGPTWEMRLADSLALWVAREGQIPVGCTVIAHYRDRMLLSGHPQYPNIYFASRQGDMDDWDFAADPEDTGRALFGQPTGGGEIGEPIVAMCPYNDDVLIFMCWSSIWILRGDPGFGGQLDNLSRTVGIVAPDAWCYGPDGTLFFVAKRGLYALPIGGSPVPLSSNRIPDELLDLNSTTASPILVYDEIRQGLHIWLFTEAERSVSHWFFDCRPNTSFSGRDLRGFWRDELPVACQPCCAMPLRSLDHASDRVLMGCRDGYVRYHTDSALTDDDTALATSLLIGPIQMGDDDSDQYLNTFRVTMGKTSGPVTYNLRAGRTVEESLDEAVFKTGSLDAGENAMVTPRCRGFAFTMEIVGSSAVPWVFESMSITHSKAGRRRGP